MRIAVFPSAYWPAIGGVEELTRQLALAYVEKGHQVSIYTNRWPRDLPEFEIRDELPIHRLPFRARHPSLRGRVSYPLTTRAISRRLERLLGEQEAELLHVQCVSTNATYALRAKTALESASRRDDAGRVDHGSRWRLPASGRAPGHAAGGRDRG